MSCKLINYSLGRLCHTILIGFAISTFSTFTRSDMRPYAARVNIKTQQGEIICFHEHDLPSMDETYISKPFSVDPKFSRVYCQQGSKILFSKPSPPATYIVIDDGKLIALSEIKYFNVNQYFVFDMNGEVLLNGGISAWEACFSENEWSSISKDLQIPIKNRHVNNINGIIHFDWKKYGAINKSKFNKELMRAKSCSSHLAPFSRESSTNYIFWYSPIDPKAKMAKDDRGNLRIKVKDNTGVYIYVP
jgi:hypothetical protein